MTKATIGTWGKSLAVRVPADVARGIGLIEGDAVEIETVNGAIVIRRDQSDDDRRQRAEQAMAAIIAARRGVRLNGLNIRDLINEGRPGC